jgi:hypothetical protein
MTANLNIQCWTPRHYYYIIAFGVPMFILYVVGVPVAVYRILTSDSNISKIELIYSNIHAFTAFQTSKSGSTADTKFVPAVDNNDVETGKSHTTSSSVATPSMDVALPSRTNTAVSAAVDDYPLDNETLGFGRNFSFLFLGYRHECYLWEVVMLARKAVLSLVGAALTFEARTQVMVGLLVIFFSTILQARCMPFTFALMNQFEFFSLFTCAATFFLGIFTTEATSFERDVASILAFVVNGLFLVVSAVLGIHICLSERRRNAANTPTPVEKSSPEGVASTSSRSAMDGPLNTHGDMGDVELALVQPSLASHSNSSNTDAPAKGASGLVPVHNSSVANVSRTESTEVGKVSAAPAAGELEDSADLASRDKPLSQQMSPKQGAVIIDSASLKPQFQKPVKPIAPKRPTVHLRGISLSAPSNVSPILALSARNVNQNKNKE